MMPQTVRVATVRATGSTALAVNEVIATLLTVVLIVLPWAIIDEG